MVHWGRDGFGFRIADFGIHLSGFRPHVGMNLSPPVNGLSDFEFRIVEHTTRQPKKKQEQGEMNHENVAMCDSALPIG